ncbi:hypothetical protein CB1_000435022 [Camelus ferus]|nr:hypothetical protein CB1_000435022 [Camelus ferus]
MDQKPLRCCTEQSDFLVQSVPLCGLAFQSDCEMQAFTKQYLLQPLVWSIWYPDSHCSCSCVGKSPEGFSCPPGTALASLQVGTHHHTCGQGSCCLWLFCAPGNEAFWDKYGFMFETPVMFLDLPLRAGAI